MKKLSFDRATFIPLFFAFSFGMVLSNLIGQQQMKKQPLAPDYVMTYRGIDLTIDELPPHQAEQLKALVNEQRQAQQAILEQVAVALHVSEYAEAEGLSFDDAGNQLFAPGDISEEELESYFNDNSAAIGKDFYEVKDAIRSHLRREKILARRQQLLDDMTARGDLALNLSAL